MEQHRFPRRSASHGTLRSSYSSHGGPGIGPPPFRPFHKPLRSVHENSVLLHSPGALESMLKTTTETGDIGIFTIRPVPPSPLVPRDTLSDIGHPHPRPRRSVDNMYRQNTVMRPPSHRDTTSEVFSVYGSDSLKSGTSTLSPNSTEDAGQRSYSMTTCGSRHLSHHRSTNTLQSQASGSSQLQRPRSPFPYPTRLKRPGVRPASPAITENGQIDYSRMVEIDRVSYRTVHGHFKHAYFPTPRRPPPLGLRADANRSTPSLVPPGPPPNFHGPPRPPSVRTHSPASMASWSAHVHERVDSMSTRTSSLTSVTHMYRRMPPLLKAGQSCPMQPPPRYYDYTEDFEDKTPQLVPLDHAPLPPQISRCRRPTMLRDDEDHLAPGHLAAVFGEGDSAFFDCDSQIVDGQDPLPVLATIPSRSQSRTETSGRPTSCHRPDSAPSQNTTIEFDASEICGRNTRSSDIDLLPSQIGRDSIDTFNPNLDLESKDIPPSYKYVTYHANTAPKTKTKSPQRHVQVSGGPAPTIRSEQGVILRDDTNYETTDRKTPESCRPYTETGNHELYSPNQPDEPLVNHNLASREFHGASAALVQDKPQLNTLSPSLVERLSPKSTLDSYGSGGLVSPLMVEGEVELEEEKGKETEKRSEIRKPETSRTHQFRRHRRNHAALRISTTNLPRDDNEGHPHITPTCSTVPLVSPKPISPARQLKVKNSIPQLMKALPPLPGSLGYDLPSNTTDVGEEDEFAEILVPFDFHGADKSLQFDQQQAADSEPTMSDAVIPNLQKDGPKFKLKIKTADCSEVSGSSAHKRETYVGEQAPRSDRFSDTEASDELVDKPIRSRNRNKLKVRSPRRSRMGSSHSSTIRRNPAVERPRIVADIVRQKPQDLFSMPPKSETVLLRKRRRPLSQLAYPQAVITFNPSDSAPSDQKANSTSYQVPSNVSVGKSELPTTGRDTPISSMPPHGLIKRLSNLRMLLSSSTPSRPQVQGRASLRIRKATVNSSRSANSSTRKFITRAESRATGASQRFGQRMRARLSRWVRGAKGAMRRCTKKKRKWHEQEGSEQA
ncbi:hypothetical protein ANO14919_054580 [Xylariales sp. No.14919]|nr:hypothetical protein ANO14919_054580 [Xylariales sp. No.14919]